MKQTLHFHGLLLLLLLLIFTHCFFLTTEARPLFLKYGEVKLKLNGSHDQNSSVLSELEGESWKLMGGKECVNGDEECLKRRMISEAHLDYIYTQHHEP